MRTVLCALFAVVGLIGFGLLVVGVAPASFAASLGLPTATATSFKDPAIGFVALITAATALLFLAYALRLGPARPLSEGEAASWGRVLQLAFSASVALVAVFLLTIVLAGGGWLPAEAGSDANVGLVYSVAFVQAGIGTLLAVALLFISRSGLDYAATVAVHLMEGALLGVVFYLGHSA